MSNKPLYKLRLGRNRAILKSRELDSGEKLVLLAINDYLFGSTNYCWPSQKTLAADTSMTPKGVRRIIQRLREKCCVVVRGHSAADTLEYQVEWSKLGLTPGTAGPYPRDRESLPPGTAGPTKRKNGKRQNGRNQSFGTKCRLSDSGPALPVESQTDSPSAKPSAALPTLMTAEFHQFLQRWAVTLPHTPLASGDVAAWATEWDQHEELRHAWAHLLQIIELDDFFAGRKPTREGKLFVMSPRYLLGRPDGVPRWAALLLGTLGSSGQTIAKHNLLGESLLPPDYFHDAMSQLKWIAEKKHQTFLPDCSEADKRKALYLVSGILQDQIDSATLARFETFLAEQTDPKQARH